MKHPIAYSLTLFVLMLVFSSSCREKSGADFGVNSLIHISEKVRIARTSESTFSLIDKDGLSLVYGNLEEAGFSADKSVLVFGFQRYLSRGQIAQGKKATVAWAQIDIHTKKVDDLGSRPEGLVPIREFFKKHRRD